MDCEVCGDQIFGKTTKVLIDGAELVVCGRCASGDKTVKLTSKPKIFTPVQKTSQALGPQTQTRRKPSAPTFPEGGELVDNYGQVIRKARQAMRISQEDLCRKIAERVSVLQKIESGKLVPDNTLARKLEHALRIQLIKAPAKTPPVEEKFSHPMELTLGDVAVMQKKRGDR